jgi:hypothetical protein
MNSNPKTSLHHNNYSSNSAHGQHRDEQSPIVHDYLSIDSLKINVISYLISRKVSENGRYSNNAFNTEPYLITAKNVIKLNSQPQPLSFTRMEAK